MTAADQIHLPLILFDSQPGAARAEIQFTLSEVINGEVFEKTYFLASDRQTTGYFLFMLDAGESDDERLTLQSFANIASEQGKRTNYSIPVQVRFYNGRGGLIAEETIIISGEPAE